MDSCIFCKIIKGEVPAEKVIETENVLAFLDMNPKAKVHVLVIPKKHIESVKQLEAVDKELVGEMVLVAKKIAKDLPRQVKAGKNLEGYRLVINVGREGGQIVDHLHLHLLSPDIESQLKI